MLEKQKHRNYPDNTNNNFTGLERTETIYRRAKSLQDVHHQIIPMSHCQAVRIPKMHASTVENVIKNYLKKISVVITHIQSVITSCTFCTNQGL